MAILLPLGAGASDTQPGCDQVVLGTDGVIRPETSGMTCSQIRRMLGGVPAEPGGWLQESPFTGRFWKCHRNEPRANRPLVRCELHAAHFSIRRRS
jgi:hypothetical protein